MTITATAPTPAQNIIQSMSMTAGLVRLPPLPSVVAYFTFNSAIRSIAADRSSSASASLNSG